MCGRFTFFCSPRELQKHFKASLPSSEILPNFNVAHTQMVLAVTLQVNERKIDRFHWDLVPFLAKDTSIGSRMINARSETVSFSGSLRAPILSTTVGSMNALVSTIADDPRLLVL